MSSGDRRTIVITDSADAERRARLAALANGGPVTFDAGTAALDGADAAIIDGTALAEIDVDHVDRWVARGGRLLVLGAPPTDAAWPALTGVRVDRALPRAEYVLSPDGDATTVRVDREITVVDAVRPLTGDGARTVLRTRVGSRPVDVVTRNDRGAGSVTVAGLGHRSALGNREVATVLARALRGPPTTAGDTVGIGVVGYGAFGYRHGAASDATTGLRFAAVADTDARRRTEAAEDFPAATVHAHADALLADAGVDVVVVATPPVSHADVAARALRAGKHVVVEKPLCLTPADAGALLALATDGDRVLTVHQNRRWDPDFLAIRRVIDEGLLGDVFNVETFVGGFEHPCRAWHSDMSVSGGAVYDWGAHHLDWMLQLLGDFPVSVQTTRHKRVWHDVTNADQLRVRLRWDDGREAEFVDSTLAAVRRPKFYVQGTRGTLVGHYRPLRTEMVDAHEGYTVTEHHHAEAPADLLLARSEPGVGISETRLALPAAPVHPFHRNLADHLHLGEPLAVTPAQARRTVILLEAAHRSGMTGGDEVRVEP
ncbi:MAG TPA: Gfo/Idh/MocA family oxidoreductase [Euzebyales bacterium]